MNYKVLVLSDADSIHTIRWVKELNLIGYKILLYSLRRYNPKNYENCQNVEVRHLNMDTPKRIFAKLRYLSVLNQLKTAIQTFKPDILHAHYASSYGLIGALTGFHPYVISVWGSDVYDFPQISYFHKKILEYNLSKADNVLSTSNVMALQTQKFTKKIPEVTPFGVDTSKFIKKSLTTNVFFVVGIVKTLEDKYGVDILISAFAVLKKRYPEKEMFLKIAGSGSKLSYLTELAKKLNISSITEFCGKIAHDNVPDFLNTLDVFVATSRLDSESFGVAIIEASACELPVIVTNVGGLPEVVDHMKTGIVVPSEDINETANAIEILMNNPQMRSSMGMLGRKKVLSQYLWSQNVQKVSEIYKHIINRTSK